MSEICPQVGSQTLFTLTGSEAKNLGKDESHFGDLEDLVVRRDESFQCVCNLLFMTWVMSELVV
jgi:hypothetical protein